MKAPTRRWVCARWRGSPSRTAGWAAARGSVRCCSGSATGLGGLAGARLVAVLLYAGALAFLASFTRRLFGGRAAFWGTVLLAMNGIFFSFAHLAVYDAAAFLCFAGCLWAMGEYGAGGRLRWALAAGAFAGAAVVARYAAVGAVALGAVARVRRRPPAARGPRGGRPARRGRAAGAALPGRARHARSRRSRTSGRSCRACFRAQPRVRRRLRDARAAHAGRGRRGAGRAAAAGAGVRAAGAGAAAADPARRATPPRQLPQGHDVLLRIPVSAGRRRRRAFVGDPSPHRPSRCWRRWRCGAPRSCTGRIARGPTSGPPLATCWERCRRAPALRPGRGGTSACTPCSTMASPLRGTCWTRGTWSTRAAMPARRPSSSPSAAGLDDHGDPLMRAAKSCGFKPVAEFASFFYYVAPPVAHRVPKSFVVFVRPAPASLATTTNNLIDQTKGALR